ncbi:MAG: hypothetical protein LBT37_05320 [Lactobacillaceae bacterium]|nr:hypothetical protein [Lactobacillaceae bacterium]
MFLLILIIIVAVLVIKFDDIKLYFEYKKYREFITDKHLYDADIVRNYLTNMGSYLDLSNEKIPYGRSRWFTIGDKVFSEQVDADNLEYFGYSPVRSLDELDFSEYGILLTKDGFLVKAQSSEKNSENVHPGQSVFIPFAGLWKVRSNNDYLEFIYPTFKKIKVQTITEKTVLVSDTSMLQRRLDELINTGYTNDLSTGDVSKKLDEDFHAAGMDENFNRFETIGAVSAINATAGAHYKDIQLNRIVSTAYGKHGFAAEHVNNVVDKIKHPLSHVAQIGQDNLINGADRVVGDVKIQTKYYQNVRHTVNSAFLSDKTGNGEYRYGGMELEVPKDQYNEAVSLMKGKISEGKVPGHTNPKDAIKIIRKGSVTYEESKLIAQGGNLTSLKYDALDGAVYSLPVAGISFVIVFAQAKWSGKDTKEAAKLAISAGARTMLIGTIVYAGSQQIAKIATARLAQTASTKILAETVAKRAGLVISFGIVIGPSVFDTLTGRISSQQLLKNTGIAIGGIAGGMAGGAAIGSVIPVAGTVIGAVAGGIVASVASKKILDKFIEDDRVEMFGQFKEEYIDVVMAINLSADEFNKVQELIFDNKIESKLKNMFAHNKKLTSRQYARTEIIEPVIVSLISERESISDEDVIQGVDVAKQELELENE